MRKHQWPISSTRRDESKHFTSSSTYFREGKSSERDLEGKINIMHIGGEIPTGGSIFLLKIGYNMYIITRRYNDKGELIFVQR
jgi:hypothetical protein